MSAISMSSGEGSRRSSRRPESMRCQARGGVSSALLACGFVGMRSGRGAFSEDRMAVASDQVIVHETDGLHECVHDGGADELEAAPGKFLRDGPRQRRLGGHLTDAAEL